MSKNIFREDVDNLVRRRRRETLSWPQKTTEGSSLSEDAALTSARICLTHEEGSSLSDDAALASTRICLAHEEGSSLNDDAALAQVRICQPKKQKGKPRARDKDNVEAGRVATVGEEANFDEKGGGNLVGEEVSATPRFQR